jgi:alpha-galactosidase
MKKIILLLLLTPVVCSFGQPAQSPPMGWNSYDCFGAAVYESEVKANAAYMAEHLGSFGWEYIVVDYCWYYPHPPGSWQNNPPQFRMPADQAPVPWMPMDEYGRLLPDAGKFPSAAGDAGFKELAMYVHSLGLKFGIHVMRGIPRQAVWARTPVMGAPGIDASMIADTTSTCSWLNLMYGVDMNKPGAQDYYNSLFELYAAWGVDFVKVDDLDSGGHPYRDMEVEAIRKAIDRCGRPMVLSLSPLMHEQNGEHMSTHANMWRISADFWDEWEDLKAQFEKCARWSHMSQPGKWPDADMLPVGMLRLRGPFGEPGMTRFTEDEQISLLTLWSIFRSPLMIGGNLPDTDPFLHSLLTNPEVIAVNQESRGGREAMNRGGKAVWLAGSDDGSTFAALFNLNDEATEVSLVFEDHSLPFRQAVRDLWEKKDLGLYRKKFTRIIPPHGAVLLKLNTPQNNR